MKISKITTINVWALFYYLFALALAGYALYAVVVDDCIAITIGCLFTAVICIFCAKMVEDL